LSFVVCVALLIPASAAADSTADGQLLRGFALQFGVTGGSATLPSLTSGLGTLISGTYHFDPVNALRFGLSANFSETTYQFVDGSQSGSSTSSASATLDGLRYLNPDNPIKIYCGVGATAGLSTSGWPVPILVPPYNWNVGVRGCLGTEWFFAKNMSLWAEYGVSLGYAFGLPSPSVSNSTGTATSQAVVSFTPAPIKFGLSVYIGP
jgi:hypothetical protein